jgi:dipeptidyl aminopeptidase/acylaminoacyl peptidase
LPAQAKRPMTLVDLLEIPQVSDPQLSPDGRQVAFVQSRADWKANNRVTHVWRVNTDGSGLMQMTNGPRGESSPRWSPNGSRIAFVGRRAAEAGSEESAQIYTIQNSGGEAQQLTKHATAVSSIQWSADGGSIYFLAPDPKSAEEKERERAKDDVYAFDENFKQAHLWKAALGDARETRVTQGDFSILNYRLSHDGSRIAFTRSSTPLMADEEQIEVYVMDASGGSQRRLTRNTIPERQPELSPDNTQVLFMAASNEKFEPYYDGNVYVIPAGGGEPRLLVPDFPYGVDEASWSRDGKSIFMLCNMGVHSELFQLDVATRKYKQITNGGNGAASWTFFPELDRHSLVVSTPTSPGEVYTLSTSETTPLRVTRVADYVTRTFQLPREEKVEWKGADGVKVEGILTYPLDYQEGKRVPLVVNTHGGPASSDKLSFSSWSHYRPVLAARGYAVLRPNYRGSTGYGNAFLRDMVGHYFNQAHLDVITGVDALIARGIADPDRLVKMGWSGGGHMTNKIITFTDRFKAASSGAGAGNWVSMYAQSDVRTYRTPWFGGTPWQKDAPIPVYWNNSPLKDVWKAKTPTIFLVGEKDVRVPMPQSVEMYRALKSNGVPTYLYVAPREPHGWGELRHELFKMNVELDWFEKHAMKRSYTWEKAPAADAENPPAKGASTGR